MNGATAIVLLIVLALVALAVLALCKGSASRSCCDLKEKKTGGKCASCNVNCPFKR